MKSASETDSGEKDNLLPEDQVSFKYEVDEEVLVIYKQLQHKERWYKSRILKRKAEKMVTGVDPEEILIKYYVHYNGWNSRFDVWQPEPLLKKCNTENKSYADRLHAGEFDTEVPSPPKRSKPSPKIKKEIKKEFFFRDDQNQEISAGGQKTRKSSGGNRANNQHFDLVPARQRHRSAEEQRLHQLPRLNKETLDKLAYNNLSVQSIIKKCDKSEAKESFHNEDAQFDVIEAPYDCDDVLRGDNFDSTLTTKLIEELEKEMKKMMKISTFSQNLPCEVSMLDIFDNYVHWHLVEEILQDNGTSRRAQMFSEDVTKETRSYKVSVHPLSYAQELSRAIQICQTFIHLMYDSNWFYCNLLYDNEVGRFKQILDSVKWASGDETGRRRKGTRSNVLAKRKTTWFLKKSHSQLASETDQLTFEREYTENISWLFSSPSTDLNQENFTFLKPNFNSDEKEWISPGVPHIYGGRHLFRFFSHWIYKAGFLDRIFQHILKDWQMEAVEAQMESIIKFMFEYKEFCLPSLEGEHSILR